MDIEKLNNAIEVLKSDLGAGLIASDIWKKGEEKSLVSYKGNTKAVVLFDQIISDINRASAVAEFPKMEEYFMIKLKGNIHFIIIFVDDLEWRISVDGNKTPLGLLLNVALPNALEAIK